ncbi:MAG: hypothetical protein ACREP6_01590 [Candidatus Binataceae bacterium]
MAQIIRLSEIQAARERSNRHARERENLERAVIILKQSLALAAERLQDARSLEQRELLERIERLTALVRYSLRMLGEIPENPEDDNNLRLGPDA